MKHKVSITLLILFSISILGCSDKTEKINKIPTNKIESVDVPYISNNTPFVLNSDTIESSAFLLNKTSLIFPNWNDNNKISITEASFTDEYIKTEKIKDILEYKTNSMVLLDETIYFSDNSDDYSLASFNTATRTYTKLLDIKVHNLVLSENYIYFINKDDGYTLYRYDISTNETTKLTNNKVGKFLINGNFILYQNITDKSKLYRINLDGSEDNLVSDFSVDSFGVYEKTILAINSYDDYTIYNIDPKNLLAKRISLFHGKDIKVFNNKIYCLDRNNSKLYSLDYNIEKQEVTPKLIYSDAVLDYYPSEKEIFIKKSVNINNNYVYVLKTT